MLQFLVTLVAVAIPTYLYVRLVVGIDRYEKEPTLYLVITFLWGAVPAILLGIIIEQTVGVPVGLLLGRRSSGAEFVDTALVAPMVEEILKAGIIAIIFLWRRREFDGWVDGIVYGAMTGFGFAFVENIFYLAGTDGWTEWVRLFFLRILIFGLMHGFWTSLTGIGFGIARNSASVSVRRWSILLGLGAAIFSHTLHNSAMVLNEQSGGSTFNLALINYGILALLLLGLRFVAAHTERTMMRTYLRDEVGQCLSSEAYDILCGMQSHALASLRLAPAQQRAFIQAAAELAQKKREFLKTGDQGASSTEIDKLRLQLAAFAR